MAQKQTPVFFGSGYNNFGVQEFLDKFLELAQVPVGRNNMHSGEAQVVEPASEDFSGFVFKLQANMDPRHRDRIAFVRVCSGLLPYVSPRVCAAFFRVMGSRLVAGLCGRPGQGGRAWRETWRGGRIWPGLYACLTPVACAHC